MNELLQWFQAQDHTTQVLLAFWGSWGVITAVVGVLSFVAWLVKRRRQRREARLAGIQEGFYRALDNMMSQNPVISGLYSECPSSEYAQPDSKSYKPKPLSERHAEMKARLAQKEGANYIHNTSPSDPPPATPKDWPEDHWLEVSGKIAPSVYTYNTTAWRKASESADDDTPTVREAAENLFWHISALKRDGRECVWFSEINEKMEELREALDAEEDEEEEEEEPDKVWYHPGSEKQAAEELLIFLEESLNASPPAPDAKGLYWGAMRKFQSSIDQEDEKQKWIEALGKMRSEGVMVVRSEPSPVEQMAREIYIDALNNNEVEDDMYTIKELAYKAARAFYEQEEE